MPSPAIAWFRLDLRLADNPALRAALDHGGPVIPAYIHDPEAEGDWRPGGASDWWLHHALSDLGAQLAKAGSPLVIRRGPAERELLALAKETGAGAVFWNRRYEPRVQARDASVKQALRAAGLAAESFNGGLLHDPTQVRNLSGKPFQVFTPFWKHCLSHVDFGKPLPAPRALPRRTRPRARRPSRSCGCCRRSAGTARWARPGTPRAGAPRRGSAASSRPR